MSDPRPPLPHVVLLDGTLASLSGPAASHIGTIRSMLRRAGPVRVHYAPGIQMESWRDLSAVATGRGTEAQILAAYGWLASHWRPGDPLFIFGYSRGAFAARSLAGMIGRVGLLTPRHATERNTRLAWRLYQRSGADAAVPAGFRRRCHADVPVEMLGVFDTVMALGLRLPLLWVLTEGRHRFHDARLGAHVRFAAQALALDETRAVFQPILWEDSGDGRVLQRWFLGSHGDVGGQIGPARASRPLANIPLRWMLELAEARGLPLRPRWRDRLPCDPGAPSVGNWRGFGAAFLLRAPRTVGMTGHDRLHESVPLPYRGPALIVGTRRPRRRGLRPWRQPDEAGPV